ncbi:MAG: LLM class F420-dependent oxidoreductase, partial [Caulobacterales bacterium]
QRGNGIMKVGAVYPQIELNGDPEAVDSIARHVEALGYDHFLMYDHVVGAVHEGREPALWGPYTERDPFHDPLVAFGYVAAITKRIELVTGILILPQRQTVLVAKQATDVDLLSGGRLRLGVGTGWNYVEYDSLGESFDKRGAKMTEQIGYLRRLWSEPVMSFDGEFDKMDRACIIPRPRRQIPIWCGGFAEPAYRRAAKMADGFIFASAVHLAMPAWTRVQELLKVEGRPVAGFGAHYLLQTDRAAGLPLQEALDSVRRWQDAGGTHVSVVTMGLGYKTLQQHLDHYSEVWAKLDSSLKN